MERLIQDLMSLSRLEVQETKPITTKCSIFDIIEELLENLKPIAIDSKVTISNNISKKMEPITGDHSQLTQMYSNLIENGIKYSGPGSKIKIYESKEKSTSMIAIVVADNGKGISSEHINRLTERFYRANSNAELEKEGTGLGLSIVKHILIRHGGRLQIRSQLSKGSKFITWLPHSVSKKKRKSEKKVS
jgi:two-component system phosphate regulon sensor histidine kinase PhoR